MRIITVLWTVKREIEGDSYELKVEVTGYTLYIIVSIVLVISAGVLLGGIREVVKRTRKPMSM